MFRASSPVTSTAFHDRDHELAQVLSALDALKRGAPRWLAIIGPRKVGKTSLILEAARRAEPGVNVAVVDIFERAPLDLGIFRLITARALDALLAEEAGASLSRRLDDPREFRAALHAVGSLRRVRPALRTELERLAEDRPTPDAVRRWLQLPEDLCLALDRRLLVAIDEVQEIASLERRGFAPFAVMRAAWQRHQRVAYLISGSAPSLLRELVSSKSSPFFQHFHVFELGAFTRKDAVALLVDAAPEDRRISRAIAGRVFDIVGGHPFYLQLVGEALTSEPPPYDEDSLKPVVQTLVFSPTGRLSLFFANEHARLVGNAATSAATLRAVAEHAPVRLTDVANAIGSSTASTARYLERLGDAITRDEDGRYRVVDALFATWIRWRSPGGTTVPMSVIGDDAERSVAAHLASLGFDLVYQSRASRGAFDLLALRGPDQLGVQVKRSRLPVRFTRREWNRMEADAARLGWRWAVAAVDDDGGVRILDPQRARKGRQLRLDASATIENVLRWIDH